MAATGTGTISLTGTGSAYDFMFSGANNILAASGAITLTGTTSGGGLKADSSVTTIGYKAGTAVTTSTSNITITDDSMSLAAGNGLQVNTKGRLTIQPYGNNFTSLTYPIADFGVSSDVTGLTIGKDIGSTAHTDTITIGSATSIAGPINVFAGTINVNANLSSTQANAQILLKASGDIVMASGVDITTQGGRQVFWSDSDASGAGGIVSINSSANYGLFTTNGGDIVMGGGAGTTLPTGAAYGLQGVNLTLATLNAGSGDISMRGISSATVNYGIGLRFFDNVTLTGRNISLVGQGSANTAASIANWGISFEGGGITGSGAVSLTGTGGGSGSTGADNHGVLLYNASITGTGSGTVTLTGTGGGKSGSGTNNDGLRFLGGTTVKTATGALTLIGTAGLNADSDGISMDASGVTNTLGDATTQSGRITLRGNKLSFTGNGTNQVLGTGTLAI
ncbi:MAG: hypothetical protein EB125_10565, partial [Betaproteobacteria bacterium]|nr:hypothetical protein [Betaproteobacteria bacterium]